MDKKSFVFHFDYINDIPEELRGQWALFIIDYAQTGIEPALHSWMEQKLWNSIKTRIDTESSKYQSKMANLKQNTRKNLHSIERRFSETENQISDTEKRLSDTEKAISETENDFSDTENQFSEGVYVNEFVNVFDNVNEFVGVSVTDTNQPTLNSPNINSTLSTFGFSLDDKTLNKINQSLETVGFNLSPTLLNYAYQIVSSKFYGKGAEKQRFLDKTIAEQKKIFVSALLKYPGDVLIDFQTWQDKANADAEKARIKSAEAKARANPPRVCVCGEDLIPKGGSYICFNCRRTFELINGNWEVNE